MDGVSDRSTQHGDHFFPPILTICRRNKSNVLSSGPSFASDNARYRSLPCALSRYVIMLPGEFFMIVVRVEVDGNGR